MRPMSQHHHHTGRLRPLFTREQQQEGICLLRWQGSLPRQPCKWRGGASGSASPMCRTWEPLFFSPAVFAPAFALVSWGKPRSRGHRTPTVPPEGCKAHPHARRISWCSLAP